MAWSSSNLVTHPGRPIVAGFDIRQSSAFIYSSFSSLLRVCLQQSSLAPHLSLDFGDGRCLKGAHIPGSASPRKSTRGERGGHIAEKSNCTRQWSHCECI